MKKLCVIVIDSGFSRESMTGLSILAARDLARGTTFMGTPRLNEEQLDSFACDPLNHGSIVLQRLRQQLQEKLSAQPLAAADVAFILLRVFGADNSCIRTCWENGKVVSDGWTEAYLWAVELCESSGYASVANCSFGGFVHAVDGTGWEAHQLARVAGPGKSGHVVVAAAGQGDGRAIHASWIAQPGETVWVSARQEVSASYNLWFGSSHRQWCLTVRRNGEVVGLHQGSDIVGNMWNQRQQLTFEVEGGGDVSLEIALPACPPDTQDVSHLQCEGWIRSDSAWFHDHVDSRAVAEPAVFAEVIAAGLRFKSYAADQTKASAKPDVLLEGMGEISFRTPEVTAAVARAMLHNPALDVAKVRDLLRNEYPKEVARNLVV